MCAVERPDRRTSPREQRSVLILALKHCAVSAHRIRLIRILYLYVRPPCTDTVSTSQSGGSMDAAAVVTSSAV